MPNRIQHATLGGNDIRSLLRELKEAKLKRKQKPPVRPVPQTLAEALAHAREQMKQIKTTL